MAGQVAHRRPRHVRRAPADERAVIAQDLHDTVGSSLWAAGLALEQLAGEVDDPVAADRIAQVAQQVRSAQQEMRRRVHRLYRSTLDGRSLASAIRQLADELHHQQIATLLLDLPHPERRVDEEVEDQLWCMCLEAVANASRHGAGRAVHVSWVVHDFGAWELRVVNRTSDAPFADHEHGALGLASMAMRAEAIGAALTAGATSSGRWQVRCTGIAAGVPA